MFRGLISMFFVVFIMGVFLVGQSLYLNDQEQSSTRDIYNLTENLEVNFSCDYLYSNDNNLTIPNLKIRRLNNIACSGAEFIIDVGLETAKFGVEFGYENPQYDYNFAVSLFKLYIFAIIIGALIPLIFPLMAIIYILIEGLILLIKRVTKWKHKIKL